MHLFLALVIAAHPQGGKSSAANNAPVDAAILRERSAYRLDFKRVFYATPQARRADENRVSTLYGALLAMKGTIGASKENLLKALTLRDEMIAIQAKLAIDSTMQGLLDRRKTGNEAARSRSTEDREIGEDTIQEELDAISPATFDAYVAAEPALAPYRFQLESGRRTRAHTLSAHDEALLARLRGYSEDIAPALFESLRQTPPSESKKEALGIALTNLAGYKTSLARLRGFNDATDEYLFSLYLRRDQVDTLLKSLASEMPLAGRFRRDLGAETPPAFHLGEATQLVRDALTPLGPVYGKELADLYDPKNGRIDAAGGAYRNGLGTGWGFPASQPSILYWPEFTGKYDDLDRGLSHEGGHAVHFQLMRRNHVLPAYSEGPGYFFESFAEFNQILLADYLYRKETKPKRKLFYLQRYLEKVGYPIGLSFHPSVEFRLYDGVAKGEISNSEGLDEAERETIKSFGFPTYLINASAPTWSINEAFYSHPLYNINHVLGAVLADAYYVQYKRDPKAFIPKYIALLSNGFDASPNDLLKKFLGFDFSDPSLAKNAGDLIRRRLKELDDLTKQASR